MAKEGQESSSTETGGRGDVLPDVTDSETGWDREEVLHHELCTFLHQVASPEAP